MFHVEQRGALDHLLQESSKVIGVPIGQDQNRLFLVYLEQLKAWNQSFNLTAITKDNEIIIKHFIDSIAAFRAVSIEPGSHVLDIGSGAGFPGIPLKIVRPDLCMTLIEPAHKKSAFLHFIVGLLQLRNVNIFQGTLELFKDKHRPATLYDYLTTRALNPSLIFQKAHNFLGKYGKVIIYSAKPLDSTSHDKNWDLVSDYTFELPYSHGSRTISVLSHHSGGLSLTVPRGT